LVAALARVVCPRCGKPGSLERYTSAGRTYLRVRHSEGGGRRRFCYLGPEKPVYGRRFEAPKLTAPSPNLVEGGGSEPPNLSQQPTNLAGYEDALEALSQLYHQARERAVGGDLSGLEEFVIWVERKLSPLIAKWYEEAKALLGS
jgi:hypothetical protein